MIIQIDLANLFYSNLIEQRLFVFQVIHIYDYELIACDRTRCETASCKFNAQRFCYCNYNIWCADVVDCVTRNTWYAYVVAKLILLQHFDVCFKLIDSFSVLCAAWGNLVNSLGYFCNFVCCFFGDSKFSTQKSVSD